MSLEEIISKIKSGETTNKEVFDYFMARTKKYDDKIKSYNFLNENWLNNNTEGKLAWAPLWIKDIYCEVGIPTTCSSKMLQDFKPPYNATTIENLLSEWMSSLGKLNMDEFAMGSSTENSAFRQTINPWGTDRIPGGSSGWSAAAVAAGLCPAALWTDTGWSIRQPASVCSVTGFKPSYGRNSRFWVIPMASSLDTPGTFTKTVKDAGLLYEIMNGEDENDLTMLEGKHILDPKIWEKKDLKGKVIWVPSEFFWEWIDAWVKKTVEEAIEKMKDLWAEIKPISLPMTKYALAAYYIVMPAEVSTNLARYDWIRYGHTSEKARESLDEFYRNNRWEGFWKEAQRRILLWSYVLSAWFYDAYFKKAAEVRTLVIEDFEKAFKEVDAIVSPASPSVAWKIWEKSEDPLKMYMSDMYTIPSSLAGLPWISIPCWFTESEDEEKELLPVWLQIVTPYMKEESLFEIANVYQTNTPWHTKNPEWFED